MRLATRPSFGIGGTAGLRRTPDGPSPRRSSSSTLTGCITAAPRTSPSAKACIPRSGDAASLEAHRRPPPRLQGQRRRPLQQCAPQWYGDRSQDCRRLYRPAHGLQGPVEVRISEPAGMHGGSCQASAEARSSAWSGPRPRIVGASLDAGGTRLIAARASAHTPGPETNIVGRTGARGRRAGNRPPG